MVEKGHTKNKTLFIVRETIVSMIYKCEVGAASFDQADNTETTTCAQVGFLCAIGEGMVGGMSLLSVKRGASIVCGEQQQQPTMSSLLLSSTSPSTTTTTTTTTTHGQALISTKPNNNNKNNNNNKHGGPHADKGHLMTWIDAMRAQSPSRFRPHHHHLHHHHNGELPDALDMEAAAYSAWLEKHPSALHSFEKVVKLAKSKQIVVFLDYDGTLSPIVANPDRAIMSDEMRATVKELATCFPTAIISGRARPKVYEFVQLSELYYAGSHGMDIMGPAKSSSGFKVNGTRVQDMGNDVVFFQPASEFLPLMDTVSNILTETTKVIKGAIVEHNKYCVTVHFRNVKEELWESLASKVQNILKDYPSLSLTHGRKVLEVRPAIAWDKGKAVDYLLNSLGFADSSDVLPVYIGDDRTDEDAFKLLNDMKHGCSILVASVPKSTKANLSLQDPSEVQEFLQRLVHWKKWGPEKRNRHFIN